LGDVFNSRKSQTLLVLKTFEKILDIVQEYNLEMWCIPGNHDKTSYESNESFLDQYKHHPNLHLVSLSGGIPFKEANIFLRFIPFFSESRWLEQYNSFIEYMGEDWQKTTRNILCSHIAVNGSQNNDGSKVESTIKPSLFKDFDKVFLGHYHQMQQIGSNIYHLPSIQQNNFGEDEEKGFTVLYDDGSHELVKSSFKPFIKVKIDVNKTSKEEINNYINEYQKQSENAHIRFILEGNEEILKSINKEKFLQAGIDVKTKSCEIGVIEDFDTVEITQYNDENIIEEFELFCEEKGLDFNEGVKYLK
jgi:exonuclease SbcD